MNEGRYKLARQIGPWGYYAEVAVAVQSLEGIGPARISVSVPGLDSDPQSADWISGASFGIRYALSHLSAPRSADVTVTELKTNPVDSTVLSVALAACLAVWEALDVVPHDVPRIDDESRTYCFPTDPFGRG